jgi:diguanylate cyclase (GGDEF)-like protein
MSQSALKHDDAARNGGARAPRILIVDDIEDNRTVLLRRFQRRGFEVVEVDSGLKAIEHVNNDDFDVVLLDVMMPEMDGIETLRRLRESRPASTLPVIMVTARAESNNIVEALELGANDYVTKPVDFAVALARVNAQVARKRAEDEASQASLSLQNANNDLEERVAERTKRLFEANQKLQTEIAQREESEARSQYLAHHDTLTGLGNRLLFKQQLEQALQDVNDTGQALAVLFVDLDGFKSVNDTLGHSVGDNLLKNIAAVLRDLVGESDRIARFGGDEFAILQLADQQPAKAIALSEQIIKKIGAPHRIDGHDVMVGASVGIVTRETSDATPEELLKNADLAMYRAKSDGRGTYRVFNPEMDAAAQARRQLEIDMRASFARGDFKLHYQPLVNLQTKLVSGFEALMRWNHPERGNVPPSEFIPVAEEIGLINQLGDWALREACAEATKWPDDVRVSVNLSPTQFLKSGLVTSVVNALATTGLDPSRLELEITESVLLEKSDRNISILVQLRELGVRISMDDFGTGYSSLGYLRHFRFDKIKIDQTFARDLMKNPDNLAIVKAIASLGISLGIATTAEGVETEEQMRYLDLEGCTEVQGYLYSRPVPAENVGNLLSGISAEAERFFSEERYRDDSQSCRSVHAAGGTATGLSESRTERKPD